MRESIKLEFLLNDNRYSVAENVYYSIKKSILNWTLKPGDRISEKEMADRFNVSRTPVRESFITLSKEGLLEILPQRGTFISKINLDDVEEGMFIRRSLEIAVLKSVISILNKADYIKLESIISKQKDALISNDYDEFQIYDEKFHKVIFSKVKKYKSWTVIQSTNTQYNRVRMLTLIDINKCARLIKEHEDILNVLRKKNLCEAENTIANHLDKLFIEKEMLRKKYPDYFL